MNQLLLERSTGSLTPELFARSYLNELLHSLQYTASLRFDGGESPAIPGPSSLEEDAQKIEKICAHSAGVNAIAVDKFENRL